MTGNPHFETAPSWKAARTMLAFQPLEPKYTAGHRLQSIRIHVRDHRLRALAVADRTLEAHYGAFVFSQARKGREEARHLALAVAIDKHGDAVVAYRELDSYPFPAEGSIKVARETSLVFEHGFDSGDLSGWSSIEP